MICVTHEAFVCGICGFGGVGRPCGSMQVDDACSLGGVSSLRRWAALPVTDGCMQIPWEDLRYLVGEIMYGGHIVEIWDR